MPQLSVVIIAKDEAARIGACLASATEVADELLVLVDERTTDATAEIAARYQARVVHSPWLGYRDTKQRATDLATHDWVLSLDADERLSPELLGSIQAWKASEPTAQGYRMHRLTSYCGHWVRHSGWYPDTKLRLFHRAAYRWAGGAVHEYLEATRPEAEPPLLKGDLLHYSFANQAEHIAKIQHYTALEAEQLAAAGKHIGGFHLWLKPAWVFVRIYLLQQGWRDGQAGLRIAHYSAWSKHLRYAKARKLRR